MQDLPYRLDRTIVINAKPAVVFAFLSESERWASWWGPGSSIEAKPGSKVYIRHPNGIETLGDVLEVKSPELIVFTYGYATGKPIPAGASRVTIRLAPHDSGTRLHLVHEFAEAGPRDEHIQGWRFQLSVFGNVVTNEAFAGAANTVDAWYEAWVAQDTSAREEKLAQIVSSAIRFRDRYSLLDGVEDLSAHIGASHRFMPGVGLRRHGDVRHCQGTVLADWIATNRDGKELMKGSSVFTLNPDGKIDSVTSFASS